MAVIRLPPERWSGGLGLNLQRAASCCVNIELAWNPAVLEQRIGRIFQPGQKQPIEVYILVGQDCIEARFSMLVGDKRAGFAGLFDGRSDEVLFERSQSFVSNVGRLLEPVVRDEKESGTSDVESVTDAAAEREIDARLAATDEASDGAQVEPRAPAAAAALSGIEARAPVAALPARPASPAQRRVTPGEVRTLFAQLDVRPTPHGGIRIEPTPEAAASLVALFEALAGMLRMAKPSQPATWSDGT